MLKAHDVAPLAWSVRVPGASLQIIGSQAIVTPYFFLAAQIFSCAASACPASWLIVPDSCLGINWWRPAYRIEDALQAMAHIVNRAGKHRTGHLQKDKTRPRIDVGSRAGRSNATSSTVICRALGISRNRLPAAPELQTPSPQSCMFATWLGRFWIAPHICEEHGFGDRLSFRARAPLANLHLLD